MKRFMFKIIFSIFLLLCSNLFCNVSYAADSIGVRKEPSYGENLWQYYSDITGFYENGYWGFYDKYGIVLRPQFSEISAIGNDLIRVRYLNKYGVINKMGRFIVPLQYDDIEELSNGYFTVSRNGLYGIVTESGVVICDTIYQNIKSISANYFIINKNGLWGLMVADGTVVFSPKYTYLSNLGSPYFIATLNGKNIVIDIFEKEMFENKYDNISIIAPGYFRVASYRNVLVGVIDRFGNVLVPVMYDKVNKADNGYFKVKLNGKWGAYSVTGQKVLDFVYGPLEVNKKIKELPNDSKHKLLVDEAYQSENVVYAQYYINNSIFTSARTYLNKVLTSGHVDEETKIRAQVLKNKLASKGISTSNPSWKINTSSYSSSAANKTSVSNNVQNNLAVQSSSSAPSLAQATRASVSQSNTTNSSMQLKLKQAKISFDNARYTSALSLLNQIIENPSTDKNTLKEAYNLRYMIRMYYTDDETGAEQDYQKMQNL